MKNNILTKNESENLGVILLNHIADFTKDTVDDIVQYHVDMYNKLTGENLTIDYVKKYIIK